jgi:dTDP-glucose 4,6-dehydratase
MSTKILVTGGAGFIGHHFIEHLLKNTDWDIVVIDRLTYASSGFDRLRDINVFDGNRVKVFTADFTKPIEDGLAKEIGDIDYIIHMGAETHVDRSIDNAEPFVLANVFGTFRMLEFARTQKNLKKFLYFSTDEVFGPAPVGTAYKEWDRYNSGNPYAATKAGGEELVLSYHNTHRVPAMITHTMNVFGERQHPEKFIPMTVRKVLAGESVTIHSNKDKTKAGSRFWIHGRNVAAAIMFLLDKGEVGDKYNIVGEREVDNLEMAQTIAKILGKPLHYEMVDFHSSRPGHDLRYALDGTKLQEMGWQLPMSFDQSLEKTVHWTVEHPKWLTL